jgi:hypothetical protein
MTYRNQLCTIFLKEMVCTIYVCISGATSDEDTECAAEFEEVFGVIQMKQKLVVQKVGVPNILVCICMGLISWWWGYALLSVGDPLDYL